MKHFERARLASKEQTNLTMDDDSPQEAVDNDNDVQPELEHQNSSACILPHLPITSKLGLAKHSPWALRRIISDSAIVNMDKLNVVGANLRRESRKISLAPNAAQRTIHQIARDGDQLAMRSFLEGLSGQHVSVTCIVNALNADRMSPLHYAARYNHLAVVKLLVQHGALVNIRGEDGLTPLHMAARYRSSKPRLQDALLMTRARLSHQGLLKRTRKRQYNSHAILERSATTDNIHLRMGSDFDSDSDRETVETDDRGSEAEEHQAHRVNSVVTYLMVHGADVNQQNDLGMTPLHYAAMRGNTEAIAQLLGCKDINVEICDTDRMSALHLAAIYGHTDIARLLVNVGRSSLSCKDRNLATPLHRAVREGNIDVVHVFVEAAASREGPAGVTRLIQDTDNEENTALHLAVENCRKDIALYLIANGADVNMPREKGVHPLHLAAVTGDADLLNILLCTADYIDCQNEKQETPLHRAAEFDRASVIELLIKEGANKESKDKNNFTPLILAASQGHVSSIECLLRYGANLYAADKDDKTAIYWAAKQNRYDALVALLQDERSQFLINRTDRCGNSPLHIAATKGYFAVTQCLLEHGAQMDQKNEDEQMPVHLAAKYGRTKIIRDLMRHNKQIINGEDEEGNSPLHLAALDGHENVIRALVEVGANIEARNAHLWTPLDCAASKGQINAVRVLLECNSPIDTVDRGKTTPLHLAAAAGSVQVVMLLLKWGAKISRLDDQKRNCLELAIENSNKDVAMAIVQSSQWLEALRRSDFQDRCISETPLRKLIKTVPEVAEEVLNRCTTSNQLPTDHPQYTVTFNYEFLEDMNDYDCRTPISSKAATNVCDKTKQCQKEVCTGSHLFYTERDRVIKEHHPLMIMVRSRRQKLLAHPLCISLIHAKWVGFGRYVYYSNLLSYLIFVAFVTIYVLTSPPPFYRRNGEDENDEDISEDDYYVDSLIARESHQGRTLVNDTKFVAQCPYTVNKGKLLSVPRFTYVAGLIVIILGVFHVVREVFQMIMFGVRYFGVENLMEWSCYVTALLLVFNFSHCSSITGVRQPWQWQVGSIAIFLAWINLILFIRKLPYLGIYVVMFTDVLATFCKVCVVFFFFIVAFGLGFHTIMYYKDPYAYPGKSIVRELVMMLAEIEFDTLFEDAELRYPWPTYFLLITFLIFVCIICMNLLVGLAVDDIKTVQEQASLKRLAMQVELVLNVEGMLPRFLQERFTLREKCYMPNQERLSFWSRFSRRFQTTPTVSQALLVNEKTDSERVQECLETMMVKLNFIESDMSRLEYQNQKLKLLVAHVIEKQQGVEWSDDVDLPEYDNRYSVSTVHQTSSSC